MNESNLIRRQPRVTRDILESLQPRNFQELRGPLDSAVAGLSSLRAYFESIIVAD